MLVQFIKRCITVAKYSPLMLSFILSFNYFLSHHISIHVLLILRTVTCSFGHKKVYLIILHRKYSSLYTYIYGRESLYYRTELISSGNETIYAVSQDNRKSYSVKVFLSLSLSHSLFSLH